MTIPKYLYHYTSLETLALILNHKTLAFNSLLNVDDMEEGKTADMGNLGKYIYVSCWTDVEAESIAMWNLYTPNMPLLYPITYTQDKALRVPKARGGTKEDVQRFLSLESLGDLEEDINVNYSFAMLGKFKNENWSFQREWRYWFFVTPMGMQDVEVFSADEGLKKQQEIIRRLEDTERKAPYQRYFMDLDEECIKQMEIVLGPRTTEGGRILAHALLKEHGLEQNCRDSSLRIR